MKNDQQGHDSDEQDRTRDRTGNTANPGSWPGLGGALDPSLTSHAEHRPGEEPQEGGPRLLAFPSEELAHPPSGQATQERPQKGQQHRSEQASDYRPENRSYTTSGPSPAPEAVDGAEQVAEEGPEQTADNANQD